MINGSIQATIFFYYEYYVPSHFRDIEEVVKFVLRLYTNPFRNLSTFDKWYRKRFEIKEENKK